jgi:[ribosomal protein S5]-alanine N-acetyltransferase
MKTSREVLWSERLRLEVLREEHATLLYAPFQDRRIYTFIPQDPPESLDQLQQRYRRLAMGSSPDGQEIWLNWVVFNRRAEDPIGIVELTAYTASRAADFAYLFVPQFWRRGFAREACTKVLDEVRARGWVNVIRATMDVENVASISLAERLGFRRVGECRDVAVFKGRTSSEYTYELEMHDLARVT